MSLQKSKTLDPRTIKAETRFKSSTGDLLSEELINQDDSNLSLLIDRVETLVNETGSLRQDFNNRPLKWTERIFDLGEAEYIINEPITIVIEEFQNEDNFVARFSELELFGEGATEILAIDDLKREILDLYDELEDISGEDIGELPSRWWRILNLLIKKN